MLSGNHLTQRAGEALNTVNTLTSLRVLDLSNNQLTGAITDGDIGEKYLLDHSGTHKYANYDTLNTFSDLLTLRLAGNSITALPSSGFDAEGMLSFLDVSANDLQGAVPGHTSYGRINTLWLHGNPGLGGTELPICTTI